MGHGIPVVVWIVIRSCAAMAVGMGGCHYALAQATALSPADLSPRGTEATEPATSPGKDEEKSRLEREKLKAEIDKLKFDKNTTLVTSITGFLSALGGHNSVPFAKALGTEEPEAVRSGEPPTKNC